MDKGKLFEYIENKHTINDFTYWLKEWFVEQNWSLPEFLETMPAELMKPFEVSKLLYRCIIITEEEDICSTPYCSWTESYDVALDFTKENNYIDMIKDNGEIPIAHIYKQEMKAIDFNLLIESLLEYIDMNAHPPIFHS